MMRRVLLALLAASLILQPVAAQNETVEELIEEAQDTADDPGAHYLFFDLEVEEHRVVVPLGASIFLPVTIHDRSIDSTAGLADTNGPAPNTHVTRFELEGDLPSGWLIQMGGGSKTTSSGQQVTTSIQISVTPAATQNLVAFNLTATMTDNADETNRTVSLLAITPGLQNYEVQVRSGEVKPLEIVQIPILVKNKSPFPRSFDVEAVANPCHMPVATPETTIIGNGVQETLYATVTGPTEKMWYNVEACSITFNIFPTDNPSQAYLASASVRVSGWYIAPEPFIVAAWIVVPLIFLLLFIKRRKERVEEEILGKPQAPWTIPSEALYLSRLKEEDPRAWYLVRHFLMEDEYKSALLWFKHEKAATKGTRKTERVILSHEHGFEKYDAKWKKRIAKPAKKADRFVARLQRKLDRKLRAEHRKARRAYRKRSKKLTAAHEKRHTRAMEKWEKQARRARRKGLEEPAQPVEVAPDLGEAPELSSVDLAEHKWAAKAEKATSAAARKEERLQARYEKARAREIKKVQRKIRRAGRRLDDQEFLAERPLLQEEA